MVRHDLDFGLILLQPVDKPEPLADLPRVRPPLFDEFVVVVSPEGEVVRRVSIFEAFANSPFREALMELAALEREHGDYIHPNAVEVISAEVAQRVPDWKEGQVLVSLLEMEGLALIDLDLGEVVWFMRGPWRQQHDPDILPDGRLLVFDNRGDFAAGGWSRVLEVDPTSQEIVWSFGSTEGEPFFSKAPGSQQALPNGNVLVAESLKGRLLEVTRSGDVVWEYLNPVEDHGFHAFVMSPQRVPAEAMTFLDRSDEVAARSSAP